MSAFNDEFLFIHIPKCAGDAIKQWLFDSFPDMRGKPTNRSAIGCELPIGHVPLRDIERFTGRAPDTFKTIFAVVRSPYEQQLSQWMFWADRYRRGDRHSLDVCAASHTNLESWLRDPGCDFHVWYEHVHGGVRPVGGPRDLYAGFPGYYHYWISVDGEVPQNVELVHIKSIGTQIPGLVGGNDLPPIPTTNTGPRTRPAQEYYTPGAAGLVESKFRWAFDNVFERWGDDEV